MSFGDRKKLAWARLISGHPWKDEFARAKRLDWVYLGDTFSVQAYPISRESQVLSLMLIPKKVKGDRDRRPFWAGGENKVARRLFEDLGGSWFSSTE